MVSIYPRLSDHDILFLVRTYYVLKCPFLDHGSNAKDYLSYLMIMLQMPLLRQDIEYNVELQVYHHHMREEDVGSIA